MINRKYNPKMKLAGIQMLKHYFVEQKSPSIGEKVLLLQGQLSKKFFVCPTFLLRTCVAIQKYIRFLP